MAETLPYRVCDLCGGVDDHPRHVVAGVVDGAHPVDPDLETTVTGALDRLLSERKIELGDALRIHHEFLDTTSSDRHKDCCAAAGCPSGTCGAQVEASGGKTGEALRRSVLKNAEG